MVGTDGGLLNRILGLMGMPPRVGSTTWQLLAIIIVYTLWADIGYNVVLFTARNRRGTEKKNLMKRQQSAVQDRSGDFVSY